MFGSSYIPDLIRSIRTGLGSSPLSSSKQCRHPEFPRYGLPRSRIHADLGSIQISDQLTCRALSSAGSQEAQLPMVGSPDRSMPTTWPGNSDARSTCAAAGSSGGEPERGGKRGRTVPVSAALGLVVAAVVDQEARALPFTSTLSETLSDEIPTLRGNGRRSSSTVGQWQYVPWP